MGELLFLAHRVPFPPDRGDKIRSYHLLRHLAGLGTVHLGAFAEPGEDGAALRQLVGEMHLARRAPQLLAAAAGLMKGAPLSVAAFTSNGMRRFVARLLAERPIETIFAFSGQMAQFVPTDFAGRFVMDFVDVDSAKFAAYAAEERGPMRLLHAREARLLAAYERSVAQRADLSLFVSEAEMTLFLKTKSLGEQEDLGCDGVATLGNGIDLAHYDPAIDPIEAGEGPLALFTGQMNYRPNVEAVTVFARDSLPLIRARFPAARFAIVGREPSEAVWRLAGDAVIVTGAVPDTRPWLARADVVVAPLRLARGVQNKLLEAMAMARPIVASAAAYKGINAAPGRDLIVADEAAAAEAGCGLLADPARAAAIGRAARACVEARYGWNAVLAPLAGMIAP